MEEPPSTSDDLRSRVLGALAWKGVSKTLAEVLKVAVAIILARALTPREFGLAAMVLVIAGLAPILSGLALGAALIQKPVLTETDKSTAFWISVSSGAFFTGLVWFGSGLFADFYGEPDVEPLFAIFALNFIILSLGATHAQLMVREFAYRRLELRMIASALVGAVVGVAVALDGHGPWAIVLQFLATSTTSTVLLWAFSAWRPRLQFSLSALREIGAFGRNVSASLLLAELNRNSDNVLIGRFLGAPALGAYSVAYTMMLAPFYRLASPAQEVLYAAFARVQDDVGRLATLWTRANRIIALVAIPTLLGLVVTAPDLIPVVLGEQWSDAVPVVQVLAWIGIVQALQALSASILQAQDQTGLLFRYAVLNYTMNLVAFVVGLRWGIVGVAVCFAIATTLVQPFYLRAAARSVNLSLLDALKPLAGVAQAAIGMAVVVLVVRLLLVSQGVSAGIRLPLLVVVGAASLVPLVIWRAPEVRWELENLRRRRQFDVVEARG